MSACFWTLKFLVIIFEVDSFVVIQIHNLIISLTLRTYNGEFILLIINVFWTWSQYCLVLLTLSSLRFFLLFITVNIIWFIITILIITVILITWIVLLIRLDPILFLAIIFMLIFACVDLICNFLCIICLITLIQFFLFLMVLAFESRKCQFTIILIIF